MPFEGYSLKPKQFTAVQLTRENIKRVGREIGATCWSDSEGPNRLTHRNAEHPGIVGDWAVLREACFVEFFGEEEFHESFEKEN